MKKLFKNFKKEIFGNKIMFFLLVVIFGLGLFIRVWRADSILGFWFDQGRDALVIWDIIQKGKLTLIGPTTGIEGIFLGPFYYYLLTPAYFLAQGDPTAAAVFLGIFNSLSILGIFILGRVFFGHLTALLVAILFAFSYNLLTFSRWLSHPPLIPFFAIMALFSFYQVISGKKKYLILYGASLAISLQLEAASAIFFLPITLVLWLIFKPAVDRKILFFSLLVFVILTSPQFIFDLRHDFLITKALLRFLIGEKSFQFSILETLKQRFEFYFTAFNSLLFQNPKLTAVFLLLATITIPFAFKKFTTTPVKILLIWIFVPLVGLIFYRGNYGQVWDYYLAGTYPAVFLLVAFFLKVWLKSIILAPLVLGLLISFLFTNLQGIQSYLGHGIGITLSQQKKAIDFIYQDAGSEPFNVDVYVPTVIPYAYDYLFKWLGREKYGFEPSKQQTEILYTLSEADHPHPERLESWLKRQDGIAKVIFAKSFGDITVQKRQRFKVE